MTTPSLTTVLGTVPANIASLGSSAVATYQAGLSSLSTGVVNFPDVAKAAEGGIQQISGLASTVDTTAKAIVSEVKADIGALMANGSKFGPALTTAWTTSSSAIGGLATNIASTSLSSVQDAAKQALSSLPDAATLKAAVAGPAGAALDTLGKASQYATKLSETLPGLVSGIQNAAAFTNTVNRTTVDAAVTRVIGSAKIPSPVFELPSLSSLGDMVDIDKAKSILAEAQGAATALQTQGQALITQAQKAVNQGQGLLNQLQNQVSQRLS